MKRWLFLISLVAAAVPLLTSSSEAWAEARRGPARARQAAPRPTEPMPIIQLAASPKPFDPAKESEEDAKKKVEGADWLSSKRLKELTKRDAEFVSHEKLGAPPRQFCFQNQCFPNYQGVSAAIYGRRKGSAKLPVFCAPRKVGGRWTLDKVHCSSSYINTLGGWMPWKANGQPANAPEKGTIPPSACFGNPDFLNQFTVLPTGAYAENKTGFHCRRRVFRVLATAPEKSIEDRNKNIVNMCLNLRHQTWGQRYPRINVMYREWCRKDANRVKRGLCPRPDRKLPGEAGAPELPFMMLTREEILYFFGHSEFFCRADRAGLVHFLDFENHGKWAKSFTCGMGRGVLEGGPFEEGVQVCAVAPYIAEPAPVSPKVKSPYRARLHCWKFARPTCEQLSQPEQKKEYLHLGNLFDVYDTLKEYRRTRMLKAFSIFDLKDSEKLTSFTDVVAFSDTAKDENAFGVKDFCRFAGNTTRIQCGYTRESMARWYEMRRDEEPDASCADGVCERGAYKRGYYCGLFRSMEMFKGKPYWMCGLDIGPKGKQRVAAAKAICVGGSIAKEFHSSKGDKSSLQCFERRFKWAESEKSQSILLAFNWERTLQAAVRAVSPRGVHSAAADDQALLGWAKTYNHTLGHRTSQRIGLMRSTLPAVTAFRKRAYTEGEIRAKEGKAAKAKELNDLIYEVIKGDRAADDRWWQEFQGATVEEGNVVVARDANSTYMIARRLHRMFQVLDAARREVLKVARSYAEAVYARAAQIKGYVSRVEVHQQSRLGIRQNLRGNIYCAMASPLPDTRRKPKKDEEEVTKPVDYVCASSPMLVAGMVEMVLQARFNAEASAQQRHDGRIREAFEQKLRTQVKSDWCYGASGTAKVKNLIWDAQSKLTTLYAPDLSSPFFMDPGKGVLDMRTAMRYASAPHNWRSNVNWLKCQGFQYSDESWERAVPQRGDEVKPTQAAGLQLPPASMTAPSAPGGAKTIDTSAAVSAAEAAAGGDKRAKKAAEIVSKVGGLVGDLIKMVLPGLGKAISYISNLLNEAIEFIEEYKGKFLEKSSDQWEKADEKYKELKEKTKEALTAENEAKTQLTNEITEAKKELDEAKTKAKEEHDKTVKEALDALDAAREEYHKADVAAAAAQGDAKDAAAKEKDEKKAEFSSKRSAYGTAKKDAKAAMVVEIDKATKAANDRIAKALKALVAAQKAYKAAVTKEEKEIDASIKSLIKVQGSAGLFEEMLTDLSKRAAAKVMELIEPQARDLFGKGFRFVRMILGIVAKAIISALASIPFVGGVLAAAGQIAYDFALNMLEDFCFEQLKGLVERFFATIIRAQLSLVANGLKGTVMRTVQASRCKQYKHLCPPKEMQLAELPPEKKWLERAFACKQGIELPASVYEEAIAARARIIRTGRQMEREAPMYARNLADKYFARFGLSYDKWMAAVAHDAREVVIAQAGEINRALQKEVAAMRLQVRPSTLSKQ